MGGAYHVNSITSLSFESYPSGFRGPEGTCFEGGVFPAKLVFPPDYPLSPPKMQFTCEMFHPNSELDRIGNCPYPNLMGLFQFILMVGFVSRYYMHREMIRWVTNRVPNDGLLFKVWKRFCYLSSACQQVCKFAFSNSSLHCFVSF